MRIFAFILLAGSVVWATIEPGKSEKEPGPPNPLREVSSDMRVVSKRLAEKNIGTATQDLQKRIIRKLDKFLSQMQSQQKQQDQQQKQQNQKDQQSKKSEKNQQRQKSKKPMKDSSLRKSGSKKRLMGELDPTNSWLPKLPPKLRDELLDALDEEFPERYRELLKLYYKSLSRER